jgi:hypothetical protein
MLAAVEGERRRLTQQRQEQEGGGGQGQPSPDPLVSKLAEMELVFEEQKSLGTKIRRLSDMAGEYDRDELPDYYRRLYERYSAEQAELRKIWDDLRAQIPGAPQD